MARFSHRTFYRVPLVGVALLFLCHGAPAQEQTAWEFDPYQVAVWIAHDESFKLAALQDQLLENIEHQAKLVDSSGWSVTATRADHPWNWRILRGFQTDEAMVLDLSRSPSLANIDKLIVVGLRNQLGRVAVTVQELDLATRIWGPQVKTVTGFPSLSATIFDGLKTAFMPLARIERVNDRDVQVRVRASGIVYIPDTQPGGNVSLVPNLGSPVWIDDNEILLPVILRHDRRGNLERITAVKWTFLSILDRDGPFLNCTTHAMGRAPLGGRTGGRTQRLALCVRAPNQPTTLKLISNDADARPLADLRVLSKAPGMAPEDPSEELEMTNWKGEVVIPPNREGLRILLIQSGIRSLARVPVVPGLYSELTVAMPDDEKRLFAEGVARGLRNELMDNLAQRQVLQASIETKIEQGNFRDADALLSKMREVPDSTKYNLRLIAEEKRLQSTDERERRQIAAMFEEIKLLSNEFLSNANEAVLFRKIQQKSSGNAESGPN